MNQLYKGMGLFGLILAASANRGTRFVSRGCSLMGPNGKARVEKRARLKAQRQARRK